MYSLLFFLSFFSSLWNAGLQRWLIMCTRCTMPFWRIERLYHPFLPLRICPQDPAFHVFCCFKSINRCQFTPCAHYVKIMFCSSQMSWCCWLKCWREFRNTAPVWLCIFVLFKCLVSTSPSHPLYWSYAKKENVYSWIYK